MQAEVENMGKTIAEIIKEEGFHASVGGSIPRSLQIPLAVPVLTSRCLGTCDSAPLMGFFTIV